jgi:hypothetical protein
MGEPLLQDLARWMAATRAKKLAGQLSFERFIALADLGFSWVKLKESKDPFLRPPYWRKMIVCLESHKEKHGNCDFKAHPPESNDLLIWAQKMRYLMASGELSINCQIQLNAVGFVWVLDKDEALKLFEDKFRSRAKNRPVSLVPALDQFAQTKKAADDLWNAYSEALFTYRKKHGSLTGLYKDTGARSLYKWLQHQQLLCRRDDLDKEKSQILRELGFLSASLIKGRGGKRTGAGRKKGSGKGPSVKGKTIYLTEGEWTQITNLMGSLTISEFLRKAVFGS